VIFKKENKAIEPIKTNGTPDRILAYSNNNAVAC